MHPACICFRNLPAWPNLGSICNCWIVLRWTYFIICWEKIHTKIEKSWHVPYPFACLFVDEGMEPFEVTGSRQPVNGRQLRVATRILPRTYLTEATHVEHGEHSSIPCLWTQPSDRPRIWPSLLASESYSVPPYASRCPPDHHHPCQKLARRTWAYCWSVWATVFLFLWFTFSCVPFSKKGQKYQGPRRIAKLWLVLFKGREQSLMFTSHYHNLLALIRSSRRDRESNGTWTFIQSTDIVSTALYWCIMDCPSTHC